ncbi:AraC family transcriptional regulator [Paenibacillus sp. LMG 31456]|uniref:AraC family transcriptional regulator n=1 Tax=Paenibacillus foliorum TaxID=2654974 RepID=A0A972H0G4_9BACL|nr:AraC family transcriptional regulator [Paenibacillus foliorum]NOU93931.1 AraC family transcriptional regulator [Paenibacillus foliorum]
MYRVMLVDDDYPVLEYLSQVIPWQELDLQLQGMYENPLEALEHAKTEMPDILITDIGMPQISGIELIRQLKEMDGELCTIILSCYNDFQFAQQAVKLNVQDYVLKESISPDTIAIQLRRLCERLDELSENRKQRHQLEHIVNDNKAELKQKFLLGTLNNPIWHMEDWLDMIKQYGIDFEANPYLLVFYNIERHAQTKKNLNMSDDMLMYAIENVMDEVLGMVKGTVTFRYSIKSGVILIPCRLTLKENGYSLVNETIKKVQDSLNKYLRVQVSFYLGERSKQPLELKANLLKLLNTLEHQFYLSEGYIGVINEEEFTKADLFTFFSQALEEMKQLILQEDAQGLEEAADRWMAFVEKERFPPEMIKEWVLKLLLDMRVKFKSLQKFQTNYSVEVLHSTMSEIDHTNQLKSWMLVHLNEMLAQMGTIFKHSKRVEINKAQRYVEEHLHQKITLEEVADYLHLNSSYFSRLYKKETGLTFIEYVIQTKMNKAKELLDTTDKTVEEISYLLGYDNKRYFIQLFKNEMGVPPMAYSGATK